MKLSLYIHIPFCSAKCRYCDFFSVPIDNNRNRDELQENLLKCIIAELDSRLDEFSPDSIDTIFIGGGTPSTIKPKLLDIFLTSLEGRLSGLVENAEFSIEANPESCSKDFLSVLDAHSVNRLSLGVQSFNETTLEKIGRASYPDEVYSVVNEIRSRWSRKLSLDIITGAAPDYKDDIAQVLSLSPDHLSIYALTFEENTPLYEDLINGRVIPPDDDLQAEAIKTSVGMLEKNGFNRYEISNFAKQTGSVSNECRHNLAYWNMNPYIGLGPAAVSSFYSAGNKRRSTNTENIDDYLRNFSEGRSIEKLTDFNYMLEHYMMGCRLTRGIDPVLFTGRFGYPPEYFIPETVMRWREQGLLAEKRCALNDEGMLLMNRFLSEVYDELQIM